MIKYLLLGLVVYFAYQFFSRREIPAPKNANSDSNQQRPSGSSDDEFIDYEELE